MTAPTRLTATLSRRTAIRLVLGGTVLLLTCSAIASSDVGAQASGAFTATARADSYQVTVVDRALPLVPEGIVTTSVSSAQVLLNSLGQSQGFAAGPDLDFVATLPPTANGLLGGQAPPLPDYPLQVTSDHPTQGESIQELGPYRLEARSTAHSSFAQNRAGLSTTSPALLSVVSAADVTRDESTGAVTARASTTTDPVQVGGLLQIGRIESTASATALPDEPPALTSSFTVGALTIAGVAVEIDENGVSVADSTIPLDATPVAESLAGAGISLALVPEERTDTSIISAGLSIEYSTDVPTQGKVTTRFVLGRTSASADASAPPARRPVGPVNASVSPPSPTVPASGPTLMPPAPEPQPAVPSAPLATNQPAAPAASLGFAPVLGDWANWRFYLSLIVAAGVGLLGTRALGILAVRLDTPRPPSPSTNTPTLRLRGSTPPIENGAHA